MDICKTVHLSQRYLECFHQIQFVHFHEVFIAVAEKYVVSLTHTFAHTNVVAQTGTLLSNANVHQSDVGVVESVKRTSLAEVQAIEFDSLKHDTKIML